MPCRPDRLPQTDAECTDPQIGDNFAAFLLNELDENGMAQFQKHLESCLLCRLRVHNWEDIKGGLLSHAV